MRCWQYLDGYYFRVIAAFASQLDQNAKFDDNIACFLAGARVHEGRGEWILAA
jgi:hypothetical protein